MGTSTIEVDFRGLGGETNASLFPQHYLQNSSNYSVNEGTLKPKNKPKQPTSSAKKREDLRIHTAIDENF
jgi:hypothetical protein